MTLLTEWFLDFSVSKTCSGRYLRKYAILVEGRCAWVLGNPPDEETTRLYPRALAENCLIEISDRLRCLYSAEVTEQDGSLVLTVPEREISTGDLAEGETYRVALLDSPSDSPTTDTETDSSHDDERPDPPVSVGETRLVEIENIGDQGDGIARVERGFVVIVPHSRRDEVVRIEITAVQETVAFGEVIERVDYK